MQWVPLGRLMLENVIQSGANLVQLFIQVLKHKTKILNLFFFIGPIFLDLRKCIKYNFVIFQNNINVLLRLLIFCTVIQFINKHDRFCSPHSYGGTKKKMFLLKTDLCILLHRQKHQCANDVHRLMPFCFYFKSHRHFPNLTGKHTILETLKVAFFRKKKFYYYFVTLVGTPMNNCAKYQHHKPKFNFFF